MICEIISILKYIFVKYSFLKFVLVLFMNKGLRKFK